MVFCNLDIVHLDKIYNYVTILILIDGFLQYLRMLSPMLFLLVTILILIDGFLQFDKEIDIHDKILSHNPYFNRWFSAILSRCYFPYDKDLSQSLF